MASNEKFCLRWNDFESNISVAFRELRDEKDFFDITLAVEDSHQVQAHKVILSACSPFFRNILRRNPHQHPLLYLKGVKHKELVAVLNFMYQGEVNVAQEELNSFLAVAEELKVKGLTQSSSECAKPDISSSNSNSNRSATVRPRDLADRDAAAGSSSQPPAKRPRPSTTHQPSLSTGDSNFPSSNKGLKKSPSLPPARHDNDDDDDIQEVVPVVKSEPRDGGTPTALSLSSVHAVTPMDNDSYQNSGGGDGGGGSGTVALEESYQDDGYDYEGYEESGYDDGSGGYDPTTGLPLAGGDGIKGAAKTATPAPNIDCGSHSASSSPRVAVKKEQDACAAHNNDDHDESDDALARRWDVEIEARISLDINLYICLACAGSKYSSRDKLNLIRHIRAKHLPEFDGFVCELCPRILNTRHGFETHMGRLHNILTVHPHQHSLRRSEKNNAVNVKDEEDSIVDDSNE